MSEKFGTRISVVIGIAMTLATFMYAALGMKYMMGMYALFTGSVWSSVLRAHDRVTVQRRRHPGS